MMGEGLVLYLPEFWFHGVLNVGDVVAGAIQTRESFSEWIEKLDSIAELEKAVSNRVMKENHRIPLSDLERRAKHKKMRRLHLDLLEMGPSNSVHEFFTGLENAELGIV